MVLHAGPRDLAVSFMSVCEGVSGSVLMGVLPTAKPLWDMSQKMTRTSSEVDLPVLIGASELVSEIFSIEALSCSWQKENLPEQT